jgi:hypothetical protein
MDELTMMAQRPWWMQGRMPPACVTRDSYEDDERTQVSHVRTAAPAPLAPLGRRRRDLSENGSRTIIIPIPRTPSTLLVPPSSSPLLASTSVARTMPTVRVRQSTSLLPPRLGLLALGLVFGVVVGAGARPVVSSVVALADYAPVANVLALGDELTSNGH